MAEPRLLFAYRIVVNRRAFPSSSNQSQSKYIRAKNEKPPRDRIRIKTRAIPDSFLGIWVLRVFPALHHTPYKSRPPGSMKVRCDYKCDTNPRNPRIQEWIHSGRPSWILGFLDSFSGQLSIRNG